MIINKFEVEVEVEYDARAKVTTTDNRLIDTHEDKLISHKSRQIT